MAKKKSLSSPGIDLSGLTAAQLEALAVEAKAKAIELGEKEAKVNLKAMKENGELTALQKEWAALGREGKKLSRPAKFEIVIPVRFTMNTEGPYEGEDLDNYISIGESDLFTHTFTATLLKDNNLTKEQRKVLVNVVDDYASNACDEIFDLVPKELMSHYDAFAEKVSTFVKKVVDKGLTLEDLK